MFARLNSCALGQLRTADTRMKARREWRFPWAICRRAAGAPRHDRGSTSAACRYHL